jgi:hypothetical protein
MDFLASLLLRYGHWLTWGLIVATLLFAPLLRDELPRGFARGWARGRARQRAHEALQSLGAPDTDGDWVEGRPLTVEGRLVLEGPAAARFDDGQPALVATAASEQSRHSARAERLLLEVGRYMLVLEGPIVLLAGAREVRLERALAGLPDIRQRIPPPSGNGVGLDDEARVVLRSVGEGARVRVRGIASRPPPSEDPEARAAGRPRAWRLEAPPGDGRGPGVLEMAAVQLDEFHMRPGKGPPENQGAFRMACALVVLAASAGLGDWGLMEARRERPMLRYDLDGPPCTEEPPGWGSVLAATSPFHRRAALGRRVEQLRSLCTREPWMKAQMVDLELRALPCGARVGLLVDLHQYEEAARKGAGCGSGVAAEGVGRAFLAQGQLEKASKALVGLNPAANPDTIAAPLLAGRYSQAAQAARGLAMWQSSLKHDWDAHAHERGAELECVAAALDVRAGLSSGLQVLEAGRGGEAHLGCTLLLADLREGPERLALLAPLLAQPPQEEGDVWGRRRRELACLLALEVAPDTGCWGAVGGGEGPWRTLFDHDFGAGHRLDVSPGLAEAILPRLGSGAEGLALRATFGAELARLDSLAGDHVSARTRIDQALADLEQLAQVSASDVAFALEHMRALVAELALREGHSQRVDEVLQPDSGSLLHVQLQGLLRFLQGEPLSVLASSEWLYRDDTSLALWSAVATGDGAEVARVLEHDQPLDRTAVLLGAPRIQHHQEALVEWLEWGDLQRLGRRTPMEFLRDQGNRALLLRVLGRPGLAAPREQAARRLRDALLARPPAVPLFLLDN